MFKLRKSTFETNSSSAHTLVITNINENSDDAKKILEDINANGSFKIKSLDEDFRIPINTDIYFSTSFEIITNWYEKLIYIINSIRQDYNDFDILLEVIKKRYPHCKGFCVDLSNFDEHESLFDNKVFSYGVLDNMFSGIDHQSVDLIDHGFNAFMKIKDINDKSKANYFDKIIFDKNFIIVTDDDGDDTLETLLYGGFFKAEKIKYILTDIFSEKAKFVSCDDYYNS